MNHVRWVAWGVVDVEALDRLPRRNFIKKLRTELEEKGAVLHCGGSTQQPWYSAVVPGAKNDSIKRKDMSGDPCKQAYGGKDSLKKLCGWLLIHFGEEHERCTDGSVRGAGAGD